MSNSLGMEKWTSKFKTTYNLAHASVSKLRLIKKGELCS